MLGKVPTHSRPAHHRNIPSRIHTHRKEHLKIRIHRIAHPPDERRIEILPTDLFEVGIQARRNFSEGLPTLAKAPRHREREGHRLQISRQRIARITTKIPPSVGYADTPIQCSGRVEDPLVLQPSPSRVQIAQLAGSQADVRTGRIARIDFEDPSVRRGL